MLWSPAVTKREVEVVVEKAPFLSREKYATSDAVDDHANDNVVVATKHEEARSESAHSVASESARSGARESTDTVVLADDDRFPAASSA